MTHSVESFAAFEQDIAAIFNQGAIRSPIHLSAGNEQYLIDYFAERHRPGDWVCTAWRSHYHALLAGIPKEDIKSAILAGRSITLTFPHHNFISSAIVGGILPIAVGIALGLKRAYCDLLESSILAEMNLGGMRYDENSIGRIEDAVESVVDERPYPRVHCFLGDMTARTGAYHEALQYAQGHDLPVTFITEDNALSVGTPTAEVWGTHPPRPDRERRYEYTLGFPHAGAGQWIKF